jgi:hypothetical protein
MKKILTYGIPTLFIAMIGLTPSYGWCAGSDKGVQHFYFNIVVSAPNGRAFTVAERKHNEAILSVNEPACRSLLNVKNGFSGCMLARTLAEKQHGEFWPKNVSVAYEDLSGYIGRSCKADSDCGGLNCSHQGICMAKPHVPQSGTHP